MGKVDRKNPWFFRKPIWRGSKKMQKKEGIFHFMKYIINLVVLFVLCLSCDRKEKILTGDISQIEINIDKASYIALSDIVDSFRFVPLETTDDCLIGRVDKVIFMDDLFFVLDTELSKSVFVFDKMGRFKFKIDRLGQGPGEYTFLNDMAINAKDQTIELLADLKIIKFDLSGKFLSEIKFEYPNPVEKFEIFDNGNYLISSDNSSSNGLFILSPQGKLLWEGMDWLFPNPNINLSVRKQFSKNSSGITFFFGLIDTIYHIDNSMKLSRKYMNFSGRNAPQILKKSAGNMRNLVYDLFQSSYVGDIDLITETDSLLYFYFLCEKKLYSVYQYKLSKNIKIYQHNMLVDPFFSQFPLASIDHSQLIYAMDVANLLSDFEELPDKMKEKYINNSFWEIYGKLDSDDNPILMIAHFKYF
jgi:hypothetical protein